MKVVFILGPTASGKTRLAIDLAKEFGGEIISCDSIQVYEGLNIGSSKPTAVEQQGVKHHLLSTVKTGEKYTAGDFRRDALSILQNSKQKIMWIVGGTGFYFKALEFGMGENPKMNDEGRAKLMSEWQSKPSAEFHKELRDKDPVRAKEIDKNDSYRIFRAIEILRLGHIPSELKKQFKAETFPYPLLKIGVQVEKEILRKRVETRVQSMLTAGWISEVEMLRKSHSENWDPMQSVGYKEINEFLEEKLKKEELPSLITTKTMQLAKRQMTWLKKDSSVHWMQIKNMLQIKEDVRKFIGGTNE